MIITYILQFIENILLTVWAYIGSFNLPDVVYTTIGTAIGYFNSVKLEFPFLDVMVIAFLAVILFEFGIMIFKMVPILGKSIN
jgi:hypothetical protein